MTDENINLFIYGSLKDPLIFESVCGLSFTLKPSHSNPTVLFAELALLPGYRRVTPDNVYSYAIADADAKIEGFVIYNVPHSAMVEIDKYEGKLYDRETLAVNTATGLADAQAYLASHKLMKKRFGDRFHVNLIHELWLRKRIEKFFQTHTRPGEKSYEADTERRARRELLGTTERDLVMSHLGSDAVSDYYLEHELDRPCPSIKHLHNETDARDFLENYILLVVKQVILNQLEYIMQSRYRFRLERLCSSQRYFTRSISLLIAMRMINVNSAQINLILRRCLDNMPVDKKYDLLDYIKYAISAADTIFDSRVARSELERISANRQPGLVPLGAEVELSNRGFKAIHDTKQADAEPLFDGFKYFQDFCLDVLMWKLGGYIDDHSGSVSFRQQGFLELAPGRLNIMGELSKPATADPWVMNQLIREITIFYPIKPHSLHLSFQMRRKQIGNQKPLPLSFIKCLLALGGGTQQQPDGKLWVSRMAHDEMKQRRYGEELIFARTSKRKSHLINEDAPNPPPHTTTYVKQYKFIRLEERANYEPLIMALKGLQLAYNPADYLTTEQFNSSRKFRHQFEQLKEWSDAPTEISRRTRGRFLESIKAGLMVENGHGPYHKLHYIDWALEAIDIQLRLFNQQVQKQNVFIQHPTIRWLVDNIQPLKKPKK